LGPLLSPIQIILAELDNARGRGWGAGWACGVGAALARPGGGGKEDEGFWSHCGSPKCRTGPYHGQMEHLGCGFRKGVDAVEGLGHTTFRWERLGSLQERQGSRGWIGVSPFSLGEKPNR
jgi:hypothetical protein